MASKSRSRTKSSRCWLDRQHSDPYVQQAKDEGYRSRATYKLQEINARDKIFAKGMTVVDLGAAPGGWSQVAVESIGQTGKVLAIDILPMDPLNGVDILLGDIQKPEFVETVISMLNGKDVDLVISDMAPNLSGIMMVDQARVYALAEEALHFAEQVLVSGGGFLIKLFQGSGFQEYLAQLKNRFNQVNIRKPKASRAGSREVYLLAKGYIPMEMRGVHLERYA